MDTLWTIGNAVQALQSNTAVSMPWVMADLSHPAEAALTDALSGETDPTRPILIAGPTASGKSGLALAIASAGDRQIVNADALQVYGGWRILTARPNDADLARAPHLLYGHVPPDQDYSVGHWLRDSAPLLARRPAPVIVGGTGLYFAALTEGLAEIPSTLPELRAHATARISTEGSDALAAELDPVTRGRIDLRNPMRVQRAWEVQTQTGRGLAAWQASPAAPRLALDNALPFLLHADRDWLTPRIARRFDAMLANGVLDEARVMAPDWDPERPSSKAIGAADLIGYLAGHRSLEQVRDAAVISTRQYAKRQRTWFRNRMQSWWTVDARIVSETAGR